MNPIIELAESIQKMYGKNIETRVVNKEGADHCPTITVEIELPSGETYQGKGSNQKEAKKAAALKALKDLY